MCSCLSVSVWCNTSLDFQRKQIEFLLSFARKRNCRERNYVLKSFNSFDWSEKQYKFLDDRWQRHSQTTLNGSKSSVHDSITPPRSPSKMKLVTLVDGWRGRTDKIQSAWTLGGVTKTELNEGKFLKILNAFHFHQKLLFQLLPSSMVFWKQLDLRASRKAVPLHPLVCFSEEITKNAQRKMLFTMKWHGCVLCWPATSPSAAPRRNQPLSTRTNLFPCVYTFPPVLHFVLKE